MNIEISHFSRIKRQTLSLFVVTLLLFAFSACGPRAKIYPQFNPSTSRLIAVLPLKERNSIARERSFAIQRALVSELRNSGFVVLEPEVLSIEKADDYSQLTSRYGVEALAQLEVSSLSENDFLLGYYNTLAGNLRLLTPSGLVTVEVEHRESQRGGVIFQSGQIVQGINEQVANGRGENATLLVRRFIRRVVRELPSVKGRESDIEVLQAVVAKPEIELLNDDVAHICVQGTVNSIATVTFDEQTSGLREVKPGRYCTILRVKDFLERGSKPHVELRTPFGAKRREKFSLNM
jgi:hypothetical protein